VPGFYGNHARVFLISAGDFIEAVPYLGKLVLEASTLLKSGEE